MKPIAHRGGYFAVILGQQAVLGSGQALPAGQQLNAGIPARDLLLHNIDARHRNRGAVRFTSVNCPNIVVDVRINDRLFYKQPGDKQCQRSQESPKNPKNSPHYFVQAAITPFLCDRSLWFKTKRKTPLRQIAFSAVRALSF
ncbi:hypothetical protein SDC9_159388 [bioreactor metagenome]|uniref:Uncharacterized protein n=1 Tax=bioreactor metagenome TaxID=1076179 RepID=A0A645FCI2_9ZZZZ